MGRDNGKVDGIYTSSYGQEDRTVGLGLESQVSSRLLLLLLSRFSCVRLRTTP